MQSLILVAVMMVDNALSDQSSRHEEPVCGQEHFLSTDSIVQVRIQ